MRVLITGASGFAGTWLTAELETNGHVVIALPADVDVREFEPVADFQTAHDVDALVHLAAVSFAPDATADPGAAYSVAIRGTANVMEAARLSRTNPIILVVGSSEVYGAPQPDDLPLREEAPLRPATTYAMAKLAQESIALAYADRHDMRVIVVRPFNHIGPGQRTDFVVPALAKRIHDAAESGADHISVGNVDVRRDFTDVRDVVRAYRLLLEKMAAEGLGAKPAVVNVCSGKSVAIRSIAETFAAFAGADVRLEPDARLVRANDPAEIRGDYTLLGALTGWAPTTSIDDSLRSVWQATAPSATPSSGQ